MVNHCSTRKDSAAIVSKNPKAGRSRNERISHLPDVAWQGSLLLRIRTNVM